MNIVEFSAKTHPIHYIRSKTHILGGFAPFGCSKCNVAKSGPRMPFGHEFGPMKLFLSFPAKTHQIHHFRYKTHVLGGFTPFGCCKCTVAKSGPRMPFWHEFRPTKHFSSFSAKTHPIHYVRSKTHVLCGFAPFGCRKHTFAKFILGCRIGTSLGRRNYYRVFQPKCIQTHVLGGFAPFGSSKCSLAKSGPGMPFWHKFGLTKLLSSFSPKTHPIHYFRSKTHVLGSFAPFGCRKCIVLTSDPRMPFWHEFRPMKLFSRFSAKMHPIQYIWSKAHVLGSFAPFGCRM